jgi:ribosome-binding factor A
MAILTELRDPRIEGVTVTKVEVTPDMRGAKVFVSIMGNEAKQNLCLRALQNSAGFLQSKVAARIDTRYTPRLRFELDEGVKKSIAIAKMLSEVLPDDDRVEEPPDEEAADDSSSWESTHLDESLPHDMDDDPRESPGA